MDQYSRVSLQTLAARTLIVAQRSNDGRVQIRLVEIANELIDMMIGQHHHCETTHQRPRLN
jgi:hypothetical protein